MNKNNKMNGDVQDMQRRQFLRQSACASLGITGIVNSLAHLSLINSAMGSGITLDGEYKALVVLFLHGGNDANNMLVPTDDHTERDNYDEGRSVSNATFTADVRIHDGEMHKLNFPTTSVQHYGVHPEAEEMASMFNGTDGFEADLAFVANVGTLVEPVPNRAGLATSVLPPQLYSHADQQVQWQSSIPDRPFQSGWGGRISEILNEYNTHNGVSMNISMDGVNSFQVGNQDAVPYVASSGGIRALNGFGGATWGNYTDDADGYRLEGFERIMNYVHGNLIEEHTNKVMRSSKEAQAVLSQTLITAAAEISASDEPDFDALFPATHLGNQLKMIANLIAGRSTIGNKRQTFFCKAYGYDTHANLLESHGNLMNELSEALAAFNKAMKALGVNDDVLLVTHSDFSRTFTPNGTDGSDHAWGGHQIVMGGSVKGGKVYGEFPSLAVGNDPEGLDTSNGSGRWIPKYSVDQFSWVAANWFGVPESMKHTIFPNIGRFDDTDSADIQYI